MPLMTALSTECRKEALSTERMQRERVTDLLLILAKRTLDTPVPWLCPALVSRRI